MKTKENIQKTVDSMANRPVTDALPWLSWNHVEWSAAEGILSELEDATFAVQRRTYMLEWLHDHKGERKTINRELREFKREGHCNLTCLRLYARHHLMLKRDILGLANVSDRKKFFLEREENCMSCWMYNYFDPKAINSWLDVISDIDDPVLLHGQSKNCMDDLEWLAAHTNIGERLAATRESELNRLGSLVNRLYNFFYNHVE